MCSSTLFIFLIITELRLNIYIAYLCVGVDRYIDVYNEIYTSLNRRMALDRFSNAMNKGNRLL